jgi:hypothetical protein
MKSSTLYVIDADSAVSLYLSSTKWSRRNACHANGQPHKSGWRIYVPIFTTTLFVLLFWHHLVPVVPARRTIQAPSQESFPEDGGVVAFNGISPIFLALRSKCFSK